MNVIMIVCDTVINDYLSCHGGHVKTPNLDKLAGRSVDFRSARAASFPTVPARADFLTGQYSFTDIGWGPLPRDMMTVPEALANSGVITAGVVDTPFYKVKGYNYDRGFKYFADIPVQDVARLTKDPRQISNRPLVDGPWLTEHDHCSPVTFTEAEKNLDRLVQAADPFFLYIDTWDPHEPWDAPAWYTKQYYPDYEGQIVGPAYTTMDRLAEFGKTDEDVEIARASYAGKLSMVDRWLGRFLDAVEAYGIADDTAILFTTDHGFCFGEHGQFGKMVADQPNTAENPHRRWLRSPLWHQLVNVPLFLSLPGVEPRTVDAVASAIDIAPTVLDLFGAEMDQTLHGTSLLPLARGTAESARDIALSAMPLAAPGKNVAVVDDTTRQVLEWQPITVTSQDWTLLFSVRDEEPELYDNRTDTAQVNNVASQNPEVVEVLHKAMLAELEIAGASDEQLTARS